MKLSHEKNKTRRRRQASSGSKQMSFLPETYFNPKWPSKTTHAYQALYLMLKGYSITGFYFQDETVSQRLPEISLFYIFQKVLEVRYD